MVSHLELVLVVQQFVALAQFLLGRNFVVEQSLVVVGLVLELLLEEVLEIQSLNPPMFERK